MLTANFEKKKEVGFLTRIFQSSRGSSFQDELKNGVVASFEKSSVIDLEFVEFDVWTQHQIIEWLKKISLAHLVQKIRDLNVVDKSDLGEIIGGTELSKGISEVERRRLVLQHCMMKQFHYFNKFFPKYVSKFEKRKGFEEIDLDELEEKVMLFSNSELMEEFVLNTGDSKDRKLVLSLLLLNHSFDYDVSLSNLLSSEFPGSFKFNRKQSSILAIAIEKTVFEWNEFELVTLKTFTDDQVLCIAQGEFSVNQLSDILDGINEWNQMKSWNISRCNSSHFVQDIMRRIRGLKMNFSDDSYVNFIERVQENGLILL